MVELVKWVVHFHEGRYGKTIGKRKNKQEWKHIASICFFFYNER